MIRLSHQLIILGLVIGLMSSCSQLERVTKKLTGGLAELVRNSVAGVVEASFKIILLCALDTQQNGTELVAFEAKTTSGRAFKDVALDATGALESSEISVQGKAFTTNGEDLLLANGFSKNTKLPLVLIAVESDVSLKGLVEGPTLQGSATVQLVAESLNKENMSATVFRFIGEIEKNSRVAGIGFSSEALSNDSQEESSSLKAYGDMPFEGMVVGSSVGNLLKARTQLRIDAEASEQRLGALIFAIAVDAE